MTPSGVFSFVASPAWPAWPVILPPPIPGFLPEFPLFPLLLFPWFDSVVLGLASVVWVYELPETGKVIDIEKMYQH